MASGKTSCLFGDIDPTADVEALIAIAEQFQQSGDGWAKSSERPDGLRRKTLARLPSSLVLSRQDPGPAP